LIAAVAENPLSLSRVDKSRAASISCSVGLACYRLPEDDIAAAWRRADSALFAAKKRGGNAVDIATNE